MSIINSMCIVLLTLIGGRVVIARISLNTYMNLNKAMTRNIEGKEIVSKNITCDLNLTEFKLNFPIYYLSILNLTF